MLRAGVALQVSPQQGWVPVWRAPMLAVVVLVSGLFSSLLGAILISNKLQAWLKVCEGNQRDGGAMGDQRGSVMQQQHGHQLVIILLNTSRSV